MDVHSPRTPIWRGLKAVDWLGSIAPLAVNLMTLLDLNFAGESSDWKSPKVISMICVGLALSTTFFLVEAKLVKYPVMPLSVFKNGSNAATIAIGALHALVSVDHQLLPGFIISLSNILQAMMGPEFYLPLHFQSAKMASPLKSGLLGPPFVFWRNSVALLVAS